MTIHKLQIKKDRIMPDVLEVGTEGSVGFEYLEPSFSSDWNGLKIKAVFHPKRGRPVEVVYTGKPVMVPVELMRYFGDGGVIFSGYQILANENGDVEFPKLKTLPCVLKVLHTLDDKGGNTIPDTPGTYEQLRDAFLEDLKNGIDDALEQAKESGEFNGPQGKPGEVGPVGPPGVYMLSEGETMDDVPPEYDVAIDPFHPKEIVIFDRGIIAIYRTAGDGTPGTYDTYTIFYSDNSSTDYQVYNGADGQGFMILGYYDTLGLLEAAVPEPSAGMAYGIGTEAPYDVYIYDAVSGEWKNNGAVLGLPGEAGKSVEMQVSGGYIQWRQEDGEWIGLISLSELEGRGILNIERTDGDGSAGSVDTYTITFTDGSTLNYQVTNGTKITVADKVTADGKDPVSGEAVAAYVNEMLYDFLNGSS